MYVSVRVSAISFQLCSQTMFCIQNEANIENEYEALQILIMCEAFIGLLDRYISVR